MISVLKFHSVLKWRRAKVSLRTKVSHRAKVSPVLFWPVPLLLDPVVDIYLQYLHKIPGVDNIDKMQNFLYYGRWECQTTFARTNEFANSFDRTILLNSAR